MEKIKLEHVGKTYDKGVQVIDDLNLDIEEGSFTVLLGPSGCGKSTTLRMIAGLEDVTEGKLLIDNQDMENVSPGDRDIAMVFQNYALFRYMTVYDNVAFAQKVIGESNRSIKKNVPSMLSMVGLAAKYKSKPRELSGGEQQRVAIARALVNEPSMLLADEPTGNLDNNNAWEIMKLLEEINEKGTTVIVVTHNLEIVKVMKKRVITIKKGLVVSDSKDGDSDED